MTNKTAIEILERMTVEPENYKDARLDADELDAVLMAIKALSGRVAHWEYIGNFNEAWRCTACHCFVFMDDYPECPVCGSIMLLD